MVIAAPLVRDVDIQVVDHRFILSCVSFLSVMIATSCSVVFIIRMCRTTRRGLTGTTYNG